jgi:endoglucanase
MFVGHADKIRMQVRSIDADGKIYVDSDSFLPLTLLGTEVSVFSRSLTHDAHAAADADAAVSAYEAVVNGPVSIGDAANAPYKRLSGGTIEALGAIHFASAAHRTGAKGVGKDDLYLELGLSGKDRKAQVQRLGVRAGDSILLDRPIRRGFGPDSFTGAYLDNGLGCFAVAELAKLVSKTPLDNVRCLFAFATHEEIGRFGS